MSLTDQAASALAKGKEALQHGDFRVALQALHASVSYKASIEGYIYKAEANAGKGDFDAALQDIEIAQNMVSNDAEADLWQQKINQSMARYQAAKRKHQGPKVSQVVSVMLPTPINESGLLLGKISKCPGFSTDGTTMVRPNFSVVYDIDLFPSDGSWIDSILHLSEGKLADETSRRLHGAELFLHVQAPNPVYEQRTIDQIDLVAQFAETLETLMPVLDTPVALLRCCDKVITHPELEQTCQARSLHSLIDLFVRMMSDGDYLFTTGMHQFGYADVEIPLELMPFEKAIDTINDFMHFVIVNNLHNIEPRIEYETTTDGTVYRLERQPEMRFHGDKNPDEDARANKFGIWRFMEKV